MAKLRVTATYVEEYEADPANYPGLGAPEEFAEVDLAMFEDDPASLLDGQGDWSFKVEVV